MQTGSHPTLRVPAEQPKTAEQLIRAVVPLIERVVDRGGESDRVARHSTGALAALALIMAIGVGVGVWWATASQYEQRAERESRAADRELIRQIASSLKAMRTGLNTLYRVVLGPKAIPVDSDVSPDAVSHGSRGP